jgi:hypothetical protein
LKNDASLPKQHHSFKFQKGKVMKKVSVLSMIIVLITLAGCKKDKSDKDQEKDPTTKEKLLGKWQLERLIDETWTLGGVLIDTETQMGEPGDSSIFKDNNMLHSYEDKPGGIVDEDVFHFMIFSDSLITLDEEFYEIKKLTDTALFLQQVDRDIQNNQKDVVKMYLVR